jgi:hypothetical protein
VGGVGKEVIIRLTQPSSKLDLKLGLSLAKRKQIYDKKKNNGCGTALVNILIIMISIYFQ